MNVQNNKLKRSRHALSLLAASILLVVHAPAHALQLLDDDALSDVQGQDGLAVDIRYDQVQLDKAYWEDRTGWATNVDTALRGYANNISITGTDLATKINVGVNATGVNQAGIDLEVSSRYGTISAESFNICDETGTSCGATLGGLTLQSTEDATLAFSTTNGLFNQNSVAELTLALRNLNIYITQVENATTRNQLILKDFNFNIAGRGAIWIDGENGLQLVAKGTNTYVDLTRVADKGAHASVLNATKPGLNIELMYKGNVAAGVFNTTGAQGLIRLGASGRVLQSSLVFRGIDARDATDNLLGFSFPDAGAAGSGTNATVMGSTGLALRMRAEFTADDAAANVGSVPAGGKGVTLELAHAGNNAYGFEFGNLKPLLVRKATNGVLNTELNTDRAYLDTGNVYLNLANTRRLQMPVNTVLNNARLATATNPINGKITSNTDYSHLVSDPVTNPTNPNSLVTAIRGLEFQAVSRRGRFLVSNDVPLGDPGRVGLNDSTANTWGIGLPIYNLNTNIAIYGTTLGSAQRLGFSLGLSTEGVNATGDKSTSIMVIDGAANANDAGNPTSYYFGLRNIDLLITADGTIGLEAGKVNIKLPNLLIAASMQVAAGYLPGAKYKTLGSSQFSPIDNFLLDTDVLFGLNLKLEGDMDLNLIPGGNTLDTNRLGFQGSYLLRSGAVQIVDPIDDSILGLDNMSGRINFDNSIKINKNSVDFNVGLTFNPNQIASEVFRVKDINFYPATGAAQRLGEMVITGGTLYSSMNIIPR